MCVFERVGLCTWKRVVACSPLFLFLSSSLASHDVIFSLIVCVRVRVRVRVSQRTAAGGWWESLDRTARGGNKEFCTSWTFPVFPSVPPLFLFSSQIYYFHFLTQVTSTCLQHLNTTQQFTLFWKAYYILIKKGIMSLSLYNIIHILK